MKPQTLYNDHDKATEVAVWVTVSLVIAYLSAMGWWIVHEWNTPIKEYRVYDIGGWAVGASLGKMLFKKVFNHDKG